VIKIELPNGIVAKIEYLGHPVFPFIDKNSEKLLMVKHRLNA
jgi:hypothetical protein